jgi:hypothetical protein
MPSLDNFEFGTAIAAAATSGMVQVKNLFMSVDPYMRGRMNDAKSYVPPFAIGEALQGHTVGQVVSSGDSGFAEGDIVLHMMGWREAITGPAAMFTKIDASGLPLSAFLGPLGMPGLTAYGGFLDIGKPKTGETVFVSGAAGAVGSMVCQIAKIKGCTVIGSVGSDEKGEWLKSLGVDAIINYKATKDLTQSLMDAAPKGIDIYFDNVGGSHLEAALEVANGGARFAECGMISRYNETGKSDGPKNMIYIVGKSLTLKGFIVIQYQHLQTQFISEVGGWIKEGKIKWEETVLEGIDNAPAAFLGLFSGANIGKMLVKLG